jgi:photosystem II stability/assembly factor-like uncharacterized protein
MKIVYFLVLMLGATLSCSTDLNVSANTKDTSSNSSPTVSVARPIEWTKVLGDKSILFSSITFGPNVAIATGAFQNYAVSFDQGKTWEMRRIGDVELEAKGGAYNLIKANIGGNNFYIIGHLEEVGSCIFSSTDSGKSWEQKYFYGSSLLDLVSINEEVMTVGNDTNSAFAFSLGRGGSPSVTSHPIKGSVLAIGSSGRNEAWTVGQEGEIATTTDNGKSWRQVTSGVDADLNSIAFASSNNGYVVGDKGSILVTNDGGKNWKLIPSNTEDDLIRVVAIHDNEAWALGKSGLILQTMNSGSNWENVSFLSEVYATDIALTEDSVWAISNGAIYKAYKNR